MSAFDDRVPHSELPKEKSINALLCSLLSLSRLLAVITLQDIPEKTIIYLKMIKSDTKRPQSQTTKVSILIYLSSSDTATECGMW